MSDFVASDSANDPIILYPRDAPRSLLPERFVTPVGLLISALVVIASAASLTAIVSLGPSGPGASIPTKALGPTIPEAIEAAAPAGGNAAPVILLPDMDYAQIAASLSTDPVELCADLDRTGFPTTPWQPSLVDAKAFECSAAMDTAVIDAAGENVSASSLFFIFRGADAARVTTLRVKLNLLNPGEDGDMVEKTRQFLVKLQDYPDLALPQSVIDAVSSRRATTETAETATIRFYPDVGDSRRFNLMVDYRPPASRNRNLAAPGTDSARWSSVAGGLVAEPQPQETTAQTRMTQPTRPERNGRPMSATILPQFLVGDRH